MKSTLKPHEPPHPERLAKCPLHPSKYLRPLLERAHQLGAAVHETPGGHYKVLPPDRVSKPIMVWSTPKNPSDHARGVRRQLQRHGLAD